MVSSFRRDRRKSSSQQSKKPASSSQPAASVPAVSRLAMGSSHRQSVIQPKLKVNQPGDRYEQEADAVAKAVVQSKPVPLPQPDSGRDHIQRMPTEETIQRMASESIPDAPALQSDAEEDTIQRKGIGTPAVSRTTAALIRNPGAGSPLPRGIRNRVEPHVKANLSGVRLHTDSSAQRATTNLNARAFTHRNHIFLNRSESSNNLGLMAHELTHTVQQGAVPRTSDTVSSQPDQDAPASASSQRKEQTQPEATLASKLSTEKRIQPFQTVTAHPDVKETEAEAKRADALFASAPTGKIDEKNKAPRSPATDPAFQKVTQRSKAIAKQQQKHVPAKTEAAKAQAAAISPAGELKSQGQDKQIQSLDRQQPGTFSAEKFVGLLMKKVTAIVPKDEKSALDPNRQSKIETVKKSASTEVTHEKDRASSAIAQKTQEKPSTQGLTPRIAKPLTTTKAGPKPANLKANQAAPKAKTHIEVTQPLEHNNAQLQQHMAAADITDQQLANANEPQFTEALAAKKELQTQTRTGPKAYRETENKLLTQAENEAQVTGQKQTDAMHAQRGKLLTQAKSQQVTAKSKDEQARAKVVKDINGIYEHTKSSVTSILSGLDKEVNKRFDAAAKVADVKFKDVVAKGTKAFRENRYGAWYNVFGYGNRLIDLIGKLPPQLNAVYVRAREFYVTTMRDSIKKIGTYVAQQLNAAKQKIAEGKKAIATYVNGLSPTLKKVGETAASNIQEKFTQLGEQVNSKQGQLVESLAQKYAKNLKGVEAHLNKLREENSGLIAKAAKYAKGVWKIIQNLRKTLLSVLAKASATIDAILKNPIGFVKLLIKGVKQGFSNFAAKIVKHFQSGLIGWLTGALGPMGIDVPKDIFSLKGIFSLVTQVLGLTWDFVRRKAVKLFGEKTVSAMEKSVEIIQILRKDGVAGLWKHLKDQFTDLKTSVMGQIKELLMVQVLQAGVKWILGLLNPASAFVKAAMLIYDIVMFFVNQGSQMVELVKAVVDGISAIASGKVGAIAEAVEGALARAVPVLIGFLAALLGISGLAKKIQEVVEQIRGRIERAIEAFLKKILKKRKNKSTTGSKRAIDKIKKGYSFTVGTEDHKIFYRKGSIMVASQPKTFEQVSEDFHQSGKNNSHKSEIEKAGKVDVKLEKKLKAGEKVAGSNVTEKEIEADVSVLKRVLQRILDMDSAFDFEVNNDKPGTLNKDVTGFVNESPSRDDIKYPKTKEPGSTAYIANVPTSISEKDKSAAEIADLYLKEGFKTPEDAKLRFALVVGANAYQSIDDNFSKTQKEKVNKQLIKRYDPYPIACLGFFWNPRWRRKSGKRKASVDFETVRRAYSDLKQVSKNDSAYKKIEKESLDQEKKYIAKIIPYGEIRDKIKSHERTKFFSRKLKGHYDNVFVHIGDPDSPSLKAEDNKRTLIYRNIGENTGEALFDRYDKIIKKNQNAVFIMGGFEFRLSSALSKESDDYWRQVATLVSGELDQDIRKNIAKSNPLGIYPSETNILVKADDDYLDLSMKGGRNEGLRYRNEIIKRLKEKDANIEEAIVADMDARLTTHSERFEVKFSINADNKAVANSASINFKWYQGLLIGLTIKEIRSLFSRAESSGKGVMSIREWWGGPLKYAGMPNALKVNSKVDRVYLSKPIGKIWKNYYGKLNNILSNNKKKSKSAITMPTIRKIRNLQFNLISEKDIKIISKEEYIEKKLKEGLKKTKPYKELLKQYKQLTKQDKQSKAKNKLERIESLELAARQTATLRYDAVVNSIPSVIEITKAQAEASLSFLKKGLESPS